MVANEHFVNRIYPTLTLTNAQNIQLQALQLPVHTIVYTYIYIYEIYICVYVCLLHVARVLLDKVKRVRLSNN